MGYPITKYPNDGDLLGFTPLDLRELYAGLLFSIIFVLLRLFVRVVLVHKAVLTDYTLLLALVSSLAEKKYESISSQTFKLIEVVNYILLDRAKRWGLGQVSNGIPLENLVQASKLATLATGIASVSSCLVRISITLLLLDIVQHQASRRKMLYLSIASQLVMVVFGWIFLLARCNPTKKQWDQTVPGTCWSTRSTISAIYVEGCKWQYTASHSKLLTIS